MAEVVHNPLTGSPLLITPRGAAPVVFKDTSGAEIFFTGSPNYTLPVDLTAENVYQVSGNSYQVSGNVYLVSGNSWTGVGSVYSINPSIIGSVSVVDAKGTASIGSPPISVASTGSTFIGSPNAARIEAVMQNTGSNPIYLSPIAGVAVGYGIQLQPQASFFDDKTTGSWWAVASGAASQIQFLEVQ